MDQFSFHGPFAYRWIDDVPVERIDLRSGERRPIEVMGGGIAPGSANTGANDPPPCSKEPPWEDCPSEAVARAAMAAWN
ncbi:MAG: hypothetical protein VKP70_01505 [Cyanobacteriota bacterium]|nr:hypothetical protein [Cyanobacteriota bacterium]